MSVVAPAKSEGLAKAGFPWAITEPAFRVCRVDRKCSEISFCGVKTLEIQLSDRAVVGMDRDLGELAGEMRVAAAVKWYEVGRVSQEVAAEVAGMSRSEFVLALSRLQVSPMQETASEAMLAAQMVLGK
jgi:hypothetical protein